MQGVPFLLNRLHILEVYSILCCSVLYVAPTPLDNPSPPPECRLTAFKACMNLHFNSLASGELE
jgi:hypothetical protein